MRHRTPDRVPVMCQLSIGHYNLNAGYKPHEIWYETEAFADASVRLARRYAFDGILVVLPGRPPGYLDNVLRLGENAEGQHLEWRNGDRTFLPWDDMPHHHPAGGAPARADILSFDPDRDFDCIDDFLGHHWNVLFHIQEVPGKPDRGLLRPGRIPEYLFAAFDRVKALAGDTLSIHGSVYPHGVGIHAPSEFTVDLKGAAVRFEALVGAAAVKLGRSVDVFWVDRAIDEPP